MSNKKKIGMVIIGIVVITFVTVVTCIVTSKKGNVVIDNVNKYIKGIGNSSESDSFYINQDGIDYTTPEEGSFVYEENGEALKVTILNKDRFNDPTYAILLDTLQELLHDYSSRGYNVPKKICLDLDVTENTVLYYITSKESNFLLTDKPLASSYTIKLLGKVGLNYTTPHYDLLVNKSEYAE